MGITNIHFVLVLQVLSYLEKWLVAVLFSTEKHNSRAGGLLQACTCIF